MCAKADVLTSGLLRAVLAPPKYSMDCKHNTWERASEKEPAPNPGFLQSSLLSHHGREVERSENKEPGILTASSCHLSPTKISVFQLSANYSFTNTQNR